MKHNSALEEPIRCEVQWNYPASGRRVRRLCQAPTARKFDLHTTTQLFIHCWTTKNIPTKPLQTHVHRIHTRKDNCIHNVSCVLLIHSHSNLHLRIIIRSLVEQYAKRLQFHRPACRDGSCPICVYTNTTSRYPGPQMYTVKQHYTLLAVTT